MYRAPAGRSTCSTLQPEPCAARTASISWRAKLRSRAPASSVQRPPPATTFAATASAASPGLHSKQLRATGAATGAGAGAGVGIATGEGAAGATGAGIGTGAGGATVAGAEAAGAGLAGGVATGGFAATAGAGVATGAGESEDATGGVEGFEEGVTLGASAGLGAG